MGNVLLVVDMLVGFMVEGHNLYCGDEAGLLSLIYVPLLKITSPVATL